MFRSFLTYHIVTFARDYSFTTRSMNQAGYRQQGGPKLGDLALGPAVARPGTKLLADDRDQDWASKIGNGLGERVLRP